MPPAPRTVLPPRRAVSPPRRANFQSGLSRASHSARAREGERGRAQVGARAGRVEQGRGRSVAVPIGGGQPLRQQFRQVGCGTRAAAPGTGALGEQHGQPHVGRGRQTRPRVGGCRGGAAPRGGGPQPRPALHGTDRSGLQERRRGVLARPRGYRRRAPVGAEERGGQQVAPVGHWAYAFGRRRGSRCVGQRHSVPPGKVERQGGGFGGSAGRQVRPVGGLGGARCGPCARRGARSVRRWPGDGVRGRPGVVPPGRVGHGGRADGVGADSMVAGGVAAYRSRVRP